MYMHKYFNACYYKSNFIEFSSTFAFQGLYHIHGHFGVI